MESSQLRVPTMRRRCVDYQLMGSAPLLWKIARYGRKFGRLIARQCLRTSCRQNLLPTKANLFSKKIVSDPLCPICRTKTETICHILWRCPSSVAVWQDCSRKIQKLAIEAADGWDFVKELWARLQEDDFVEAMTVARLLWMRRNSFVFEGQFLPPSHLVIQAKQTLEFYGQAHSPTAKEPRVSADVPHRWRKP